MSFAIFVLTSPIEPQAGFVSVTHDTIFLSQVSDSLRIVAEHNSEELWSTATLILKG